MMQHYTTRRAAMAALLAVGAVADAPAATTRMITGMFAPFAGEARRIAQIAAQRLPG